MSLSRPHADSHGSASTKQPVQESKTEASGAKSQTWGKERNFLKEHQAQVPHLRQETHKSNQQGEGDPQRHSRCGSGQQPHLQGPGHTPKPRGSRDWCLGAVSISSPNSGQIPKKSAVSLRLKDAEKYQSCQSPPNPWKSSA